MWDRKRYFGWLFGTLAFSIAIQLLLPWPLGFGISLGFFIVLPFVYAKIIAKKNGLYRFGMSLDKPSKVVCSVCGTKSRDRICKRCGSNQFKLG